MAVMWCTKKCRVAFAIFQAGIDVFTFEEKTYHIYMPFLSRHKESRFAAPVLQVDLNLSSLQN